ncbi:MAG: hypothetical protein KTR30_09945 [Saprospiraceae bacterium]|nr:hypothetical protein [Saprospiraceae bacterium]
MKKSYNWLNHLFNFIAVILGVYLAFYVDARGKAREDQREGRLLMQSMVNDLKADIKSYEAYQIPFNTSYQENVDSLLTFLVSNNMGAIESKLPSILQVENYAPNISIYNSMKSSGKLRLIEDVQLQKSLSDFYDGTAQECISKNDIQADYFLNEVMSWLRVNTDLMQMKLLPNRELLVFRNTLMIYQSLVNQKVRDYELVVEESKALKEQIETLLADR